MTLYNPKAEEYFLIQPSGQKVPCACLHYSAVQGGPEANITQKHNTTFPVFFKS